MANDSIAFESFFKTPLRNGLTRPKAVRGVGTKMVNMGEIFAHSRIGDIGMDRVPLNGKEADVYLLEPGDLLFARQSLVLEGAGKCSVFLGSKEPVTFESHIIRARVDRKLGNPLFFYYFFQSPAGRNAIRSIVEQVAAAGIRGSDLAKLQVPQVPLPIQDAIASILGAVDDKIELNTRINETLEGVLQTVFKSWFVDFDPVRAKVEGSVQALPVLLTELFPASFGNSHGEQIPSGWTVAQLGSVAENPRRGLSPDEIHPTTPYIALEHMPRKSISLSEWGTARGIESGKFAFHKGEILFGKLRPYFHKVGVAPVDGVCSTDILVIRALSDDWFGFVLGHVSSAEFVEHTNAGSTGTKMPRTNWTDMAKYRVVLPPDRVAKAFTDYTRPIVSRITNGIHQNHALASLRDALLPKLVSGELRLPDAQKIFEGNV